VDEYATAAPPTGNWTPEVADALAAERTGQEVRDLTSCIAQS